jgi:G3E family GTPase
MIVDVIYGFLGSGKTTFISRILQEWGDKEKIVVLVNENLLAMVEVAKQH